MYETNAQWTITAADGTTVVFNDGASGLYLESVTGFDSPDVRQNIDVLPEADGSVAGNFFFGSRPVTLNGKIAANTAAGRNVAVVNLQRAIRGLRGAATLKSTPQGLPAMQTTARLNNIRVSGAFVKDFQLSLICPDPRIYSQTLNTNSAIGIAVTPGASFPWAFPVNWGGGTGATLAVNVTNAGNFSTPPTVKVIGPAIGPQITNATTGESLYLDGLTLAAGEYVTVDFGNHTATRSDGTNQYYRVRFPGTVWFTLQPGSSTVQLWASGATSATELDVSWRDAWA